MIQSFPHAFITGTHGKSILAFSCLCVFVFGIPVFSTTPTLRVDSLLESGDYAEAQAVAEKAFTLSQSDPATMICYAKTTPDVANAIELYKKAAVDSAAPDSLRAQAYCRLACAMYMKGKFSKAGAYGKKAIALSSVPDFVATQLQIAIRDTSDTAGFHALQSYSQDSASQYRLLSHYYLGLFYFARSDFEQALAHFTQASKSPDSSFFTCSAYIGVYACATALKRNEEAAMILAHVKRVYPFYLEKSMLLQPKTLAKSPIASANSALWAAKDSVQNKPVKIGAIRNSPKTLFSLQVGAFGSIENAGSLKNELAKQYSPVSIMAAIAEGKNIYRVRVGTFNSKQSAQSFADSTLAKKGLKFRIIEDLPVD